MSIERAFCTDRQHVEAFKELGLPDKLIYVAGRGAEDLESCLASFRDRPGKLLIAPDLRVFRAPGKEPARKDVAAVMARLERAQIRVVDVIHPQDETISDMIQRSSILISGTRIRDRRTSRRLGRVGGLARGENARSARAQIDTDWLIRQIVNDPDISWKVALRILDGKISEATLRRHYLGPQP